jgi:hypothetical protein
MFYCGALHLSARIHGSLGAGRMPRSQDLTHRKDPMFYCRGALHLSARIHGSLGAGRMPRSQDSEQRTFKLLVRGIQSSR